MLIVVKALRTCKIINFETRHYLTQNSIEGIKPLGCK
jgi:hypothetical protein